MTQVKPVIYDRYRYVSTIRCYPSRLNVRVLIDSPLINGSLFQVPLFREGLPIRHLSQQLWVAQLDVILFQETRCDTEYLCARSFWGAYEKRQTTIRQLSLDREFVALQQLLAIPPTQAVAEFHKCVLAIDYRSSGLWISQRHSCETQFVFTIEERSCSMHPRKWLSVPRRE